jgi:hypothetical protein
MNLLMIGASATTPPPTILISQFKITSNNG